MRSASWRQKYFSMIISIIITVAAVFVIIACLFFNHESYCKSHGGEVELITETRDCDCHG